MTNQKVPSRWLFLRKKTNKKSGSKIGQNCCKNSNLDLRFEEKNVIAVKSQ